jgi:hypothetical protein
MSCSIAGACLLNIKELDLVETLGLLAERHCLPPPAEFVAGQFEHGPWLPHGHPLKVCPPIHASIYAFLSLTVSIRCALV